jgi:Ca2+-binding EF-hand superfamily protein
MKSFKLFDQNNDNTLDKKELGEAFRIMGLNLTKKQVDDIIKEADVDSKNNPFFK